MWLLKQNNCLPQSATSRKMTYRGREVKLSLRFRDWCKLIWNLVRLTFGCFFLEYGPVKFCILNSHILLIIEFSLQLQWLCSVLVEKKKIVIIFAITLINIGKIYNIFEFFFHILTLGNNCIDVDMPCRGLFFEGVDVRIDLLNFWCCRT